MARNNGTVKTANVNLLPQSAEAEEAVLGALLVDPDALCKVKQALDPDDFHTARYGLVYAALLALDARGTPADLVTLTEELERRGQLDEVGGPALLTGLINATPTGVHAPYYARIVRKLSVQRALIAAAADIAAAAYRANGDLPEIVLQSRARLVEVEKRLADGSDGVDLRQSLALYFDLLEGRERDRDRPRLEFPWPRLAALMPPLSAGDLVGVIANPGAGKTAFLENCAEVWAEAGWRVAFFHLELSTPMMLDRRMQRASGIPVRALRLGQLGEGDHAKVVGALTAIDLWRGNIHYIHCPGWPLARILSTAQKLHDIERLDAVVIDYLNKIPLCDRGGGMNTAQMRGADVEDFKTFLETNGLPGLLAAQFDKGAKGRRQRSMDDARDTGELGDKVNIGIVIDRDADEDGTRTSGAMFRVVKCNAGQQGALKMYFSGGRLRFYEVEEERLE